MGFFNRRLGGWHSANLSRDMEIACYGGFGKPLLLIPTAARGFLEYEDFGIIDTLKPFIEQGRIKVYCINSINSESWMDDSLTGYDKAERHLRWDHYITEEVVPYIRHDCRHQKLKIAVAGASFGAFHAFNTLCRHPELFDTVIAMSGFYDLAPHAQNCNHPKLYYLNPSFYLSNLNDNYHLPKLQQECDIHILTGQGPYEVPDESRRISEMLDRLEIPHNLDIWGHDIEHDWPTWHKMMRHYIGERLNW